MKVGITEMVPKCLNEPKEKYSEVISVHFSLMYIVVMFKHVLAFVNYTKKKL